MFFFFNPVVKL